MSDYLPEEVWTRNILATLPIKTLLRCTSVCKSWYSLITSPSFISTHLNRNKQQDPPLLLLRHCSEHPRKEHFSIRHDNPTLDDYAELDFPFHSVNWIVGSCNGVVCLSDDHMCYVHTIILWNPSIRKSFNLPRPNVVFQTHGPLMHSIGFGFDSINHDCKVVRVIYVEDDDGFDIVPPEVELYSLSRGCWQSISDCGVQSIIPERSPQVYINGAVHWIAYDRKTNGSFRRSLIVSFNMCDELFRKIFLPDSLAAQRGITIEINVFGESLCVMHDVFLSGSNKAYDMWVMEKYSVVESWTKLFAIVDYQQSLGPVIGFRKNSEVLLERGENLVSYDLKTKETKNLGIHGVGCFFYVATYVKSLVLVSGLKGLSGRHEFVNETEQKRTATKSRKNRVSGRTTKAQAQGHDKEAGKGGSGKMIEVEALW
ncbi:F-box protein CPR1-like [Camellia sinensis]|uniref:F-box protein CPR1-like n=1 Tax=Camellia sinensis TaxID=4442 RepID=UPI001036DEE5|nr:F-box protein CPR1-like [Camellia sinensis]